MHTFTHLLRIVSFRLGILALTTFLFVAALARVHDYSQTRQAIANYHSNDGLMWLIVFYLFNEAGSGIKFALLGDQKYMRYFPLKDNADAGRSSRRDYEVALLNSQQGDWREQLHLSHLIAIGWGTEFDADEALYWFEESRRVAEANDEGEAWRSNGRIPSIRALLREEIRARRLEELLEDDWIEPAGEDRSELLRAGESG